MSRYCPAPTIVSSSLMRSWPPAEYIPQHPLIAPAVASRLSTETSIKDIFGPEASHSHIFIWCARACGYMCIYQNRRPSVRAVNSKGDAPRTEEHFLHIT